MPWWLARPMAAVAPETTVNENDAPMNVIYKITYPNGKFMSVKTERTASGTLVALIVPSSLGSREAGSP